MTNEDKFLKIMYLAAKNSKKPQQEKFMDIKIIYDDLKKVIDLAQEILYSIEEEGCYNPVDKVNGDEKNG